MNIDKKICPQSWGPQLLKYTKTITKIHKNKYTNTQTTNNLYFETNTLPVQKDHISSTPSSTWPPLPGLTHSARSWRKYDFFKVQCFIFNVFCFYLLNNILGHVTFNSWYNNKSLSNYQLWIIFKLETKLWCLLCAVIQSSCFGYHVKYDFWLRFWSWLHFRK